MNPGGEPGRDDGGLPPVDIEIPDDARELEREVLAYHREQRARRRRARWNRVLGPMRGHGAILPLVATCVALSMLAGTLLSVFSISPASAPVIAHSPAPAPRSACLPARTAASRCPPGRLSSAGRPPRSRGSSARPWPWFPPTATAARAAAAHHAGGPRPRPGVLRGDLGCDGRRDPLARTAGQGTAVAVKDAENVLGSAYHPAGLTVVLVRADASATVQRNLTSGFQLEDQLRALSTGARSASPEPGAAASAVPVPT